MNGVYNVRFQIVALLVLIIIGFDYFRNTRRKTVSTTWFGMILSVSFVYICFDILTVYTLIYKTNSVANIICHRVFFTLLITSVFSFYTALIYVNTIRHVKTVGKWQRIALKLQLYIWLTAVVIQYNYPGIMLSGIFISVSVALHYLSFERQNVLAFCESEPQLPYKGELIERENYVTRQLELAIKNDSLEVVYQPIYEVKTGKCVTAEALVRLKKDDNNEYISPEEFIPIAEKNGYIKALGEAVFKKVCGFLGGINRNKIEIKYIEINLSMYQITDDTIFLTFGRIMQENGISPSMINLEITETSAMEIDEKCIDNMRKFKEKGCTFSVDDFGTGYSNLARVVAADYELVKLDKSLIWPCFEELGEEKDKVSKKNAMLILENVVRMLKNLGVKIVAEGVETKEMVEVLTGLGVHYMQGYYFSKPICENDYIKFLTKKNPVI